MTSRDSHSLHLLDAATDRDSEILPQRGISGVPNYDLGTLVSPKQVLEMCLWEEVVNPRDANSNIPNCAFLKDVDAFDEEVNDLAVATDLDFPMTPQTPRTPLFIGLPSTSRLLQTPATPMTPTTPRTPFFNSSSSTSRLQQTSSITLTPASAVAGELANLGLLTPFTDHRAAKGSGSSLKRGVRFADDLPTLSESPRPKKAPRLDPSLELILFSPAPHSVRSWPNNFYTCDIVAGWNQMYRLKITERKEYPFTFSRTFQGVKDLTGRPWEEIRKVLENPQFSDIIARFFRYGRTAEGMWFLCVEQCPSPKKPGLKKALDPPKNAKRKNASESKTKSVEAKSKKLTKKKIQTMEKVHEESVDLPSHSGMMGPPQV